WASPRQAALDLLVTQRASSAVSAQGAPWVRTCVGCRRRAPASELLRVVATEGEGEGAGDGRLRLVPDPTRRRPGRGAHVHPDPACLALALRRQAFRRALRLSGVPDAGALVDFVDQGARTRALEAGSTSH